MFFVLILHYFWRFATLELGYAEKMMMLHFLNIDCKCQSEKALTVSLF